MAHRMHTPYPHQSDLDDTTEDGDGFGTADEQEDAEEYEGSEPMEPAGQEEDNAAEKDAFVSQ